MHLLKNLLVSVFLSALLLGGIAGAGSVIVIEGPLPPGARDLLVEQIAFYGESGALAVGEGDAADVKQLRKLGINAKLLGEWPQDQTLYASGLDNVPATATILFRSDGDILFAYPSSELLPACGHRRAMIHRIPWKQAVAFRTPSGGTAESVTGNPRIAALMAQVNQANLLATVSHLETYYTRCSNQPSAVAAKDWLVQQLQASPGLTVTTDTYSGLYTPNIIATLPGTIHPDRILVLGAHYDSVHSSGSSRRAPGADDNASGAAGILEVARILPQMQFENTIRMVLFSAEELGLIGSMADASTLFANGADVVGMLNMDMNAYRAPGDTLSLSLIRDNADAGLTWFFLNVSKAYQPTFAARIGSIAGGTSDHQSYTTYGFPSAFAFEDAMQYSPYIHSTNDTVGLSANDFNLAELIVKSFLATAAELAEPLSMEIEHTPLTDTITTGTALALEAMVTSVSGATVTSVEAVYRVDGGSFTSRNLIPADTPGRWIGSLPGFSQPGNVEYYLLATNSDGQSAWLPDGFLPFPGDELLQFMVGDVSSIFADDFEGPSENGWTSVEFVGENEWQKGTPQGMNYDPSFAPSGVNARGLDLGLLGGNGYYHMDSDTYLESPVIDCSGQAPVRLRFNRWLTVQDGDFDEAEITVNGTTIWQNSTAGDTVDKAWKPWQQDISALAAGNPSVTVRFHLRANNFNPFGGWTLDDFELFALHDGVIPSLTSTETAISASQGGTVQFEIDAGPAHAGENCLLAVSITGTGPTMINGVSVPITLDPLTTLIFNGSNTPSFQNFKSTLDGSGRATATMVLPPTALPNIPGITLYLAALTIQPVTWASNPVEIEFGM